MDQVIEISARNRMMAAPSHHYRRGRRRPKNRCAFTLIELITVIAIITILAALVGPSLTVALRGSNLTRAGQLVRDQFALARQEAVSGNCDVEVRFYKLTTGEFPGWRAMQLWRMEQASGGAVARAFGPVTFLPEGVLMADRNGLSPLISAGSLNSSVTLPSYGSVTCRGFRFRPSGALESLVVESSYVTLTNASDLATPPVNYYTIQLNALTGRASVFRP